MTVKASITQDDYIKLRGLAVIAAEHTRALEVIIKAAAAITGEESDSMSPNYYGCTSDEFYSSTEPNIGSLLSRLGIEVEEVGDAL